MLVLSRKQGEAIVIGNNVKIIVVDIRGDKVRLGIDAPRETPVHRKEVFDAIQLETPDDVPPSFGHSESQTVNKLREQLREAKAEIQKLKNLKGGLTS